MSTYEEVIKYLNETYDPEAIIVYGSYACGDANKNSDFDALVIAEHDRKHDSSIIKGVVLDVFVYSAASLRAEFKPETFVQIFDGKIVLDKNGTAAALKKRVADYIAGIPPKTDDEIREEISWCEKMLARTGREGAEGFFRWHWLLCDSLEIYFDVAKQFYFGPQKALKQMETADPAAYSIYSSALKEMNSESLSKWIEYIKKIET